jgi:hypothetical protein
LPVVSARDAALDALAAIRGAFPEARGLVLFGSHARGTARAGSDVDLLVVLSAGRLPRRDDYQRWDQDVAPGRDPRLSPHFVAWPGTGARPGGLWREVARDGLVLWELDGELSRTLAEIRAHVERAGDRRGTSHGHPYWVLG